MNLPTTQNKIRKVAILTNVIPYYRRPVFEILQADKSLSLKFFLSMPINRSDKKSCDTLTLHYSKGINIQWKTYHQNTKTEQTEWLHVPVKLPVDLLLFRPDIIISGEFGLRSICGYFVAKLRKIPFVLWSEEIQETAQGISKSQEKIRRFLFQRASGFLAWGQPAVNYLRSWNVPVEKICYCAQAVDNDYWKNQVSRYDKHSVREEMRLTGRVFLLVGRLVKRKGFDLFLEAWGDLPKELTSKNTVIIVGNGAEENRLREIVHKRSIPYVYFAGFVPQEDLPKYYAVSDVFVFPSLIDVWGLVVNEAMACGLPVLASKYAGASQELVEGRSVGEIFDPANRIEFTNILHKWCIKDFQTPCGLSQEIVSRLNFSVTVNSIRQLITTQFCDMYQDEDIAKS